MNKKVVFSSKLLRKHVHLDEGDVSVTTFLRLFSYLFILSKNDMLSHVALRIVSYDFNSHYFVFLWNLIHQYNCFSGWINL